ncbi:MAG: terminase small subunit [Chloroflexi bacterium]|nr:terminase small subunit [Chloroflexota bacterium]
MSKLTARQERFVEELLVSGNATQAAAAAGYSATSSHVAGSRLLRNVQVATAIARAKQRRSEATSIDAQWVLREAVALYQRCIQEHRPVLDPRTRKQLVTDAGEPLFTFNAPAATRALELIGKHVNVGAFEDRLAVRGEIDLVARLQAGRRRVRGIPAIGMEHEVEAQI